MFVADRVVALVLIAGSILVYLKTMAYPPEVVAFPKFILGIVIFIINFTIDISSIR